MSQAEIVNIFVQDGFFVVEAEHFHDDGSFWYMEHYRFSGLEGHKRKRATNARGQALLDDGTVAPHRTEGRETHAFLPPGKDWKRHPPPHMDDSTLWEAILLDNRQRRTTNFPGGRNILSREAVPVNEANFLDEGLTVLMTRFADVIGDVVML